MKAFARLVEGLVFMPSRNGKLRLLTDYLAHAPDPDRGYALAALSEGLSFHAAKPGIVRALVADRVDPVLFNWSYDFVGDLAETVSLIWPERPAGGRSPSLGEVVESLAAAGRTQLQEKLRSIGLDRPRDRGRRQVAGKRFQFSSPTKERSAF